MKYFLAFLAGLGIAGAGYLIPYAYGATAFAYSAVAITGEPTSLGTTRSMDRYENDEAICYVYKSSMSCLKKP